MVSKAREDLPEPESPVTTTSTSRGMSRSMDLRLCSRAPRMTMWSWAMEGIIPPRVARRNRAAAAGAASAGEPPPEQNGHQPGRQCDDGGEPSDHGEDRRSPRVQPRRHAHRDEDEEPERARHDTGPAG